MAPPALAWPATAPTRSTVRNDPRTEPVPERRLSDIALLRRRPWLQVLLCTLLGSVAAVLVTLFTPSTYRSDVKVFVTVANADNGGIHDRALFATERVKSYVPLVTSPVVMGPVKQRLGRSESAEQLARKVRAENATGTVLLTLTADGGSPQEAHDLASATAQELATVVSAIEGGGAAALSPVALNVVPTAAAEGPPVSPRPVFNLFMGTVVGLAVGVASVVVVRHLDTTVRTADDVVRAGGPRGLATIRRDRRGAATALTPGAPEPALLEDYRMLRSRLDLVPADVPLSIAVVSAARGDGRTATAVNLALAIRQAGWRVTVVDGDLRRPALDRFAGTGAGTGVVEVVRDHVPVEDALRPSAAGDVMVLTSGRRTEGPSELLLPAALHELSDELTKRTDVVLFDTPPLLEVAEGAAIASVADAVLLVVRSGVTTRAEVAGSVELLDAIGRRPLGAVVTVADRRARRSRGFSVPLTRRESPDETPW
jgi:polysaccharide biosynthesis transport protein